MTITGAYPDGTRINVCPEAQRLFDIWRHSNWRDTPPGEDVFDNEEGRAYWQHRDACPECTKRRNDNE